MLELRRQQVISKKSLSDYQSLLDQEKLLGITSWKDEGKEPTKHSEPVFNLKGAAQASQPLSDSA
jgi:hypothetical protein